MRVDALTLKQFRALQAVAQHGSMTAAAAAVNQTTPAIHSQIRNLEAAIGHPVLARGPDGGKLALTAQGQEMLKAADRVTAILSQSGRQLQAMSSGSIGHVTLGIVSTAQYSAPRLLMDLMRVCPDIAVSMIIGNRESIVAGLDRGTLDLAVMGRPPRQPVLRAVPVGPHPHGILLPAGHPLAAGDGFDPDMLMQETFLMREEGSGSRMLLQRFLDRLNPAAPPRLIELNSNEAIKQGVLCGLGIAMLSLHAAHDELAAGRLVPLRGPGLPMMRQWYVAVPTAIPVPAPVTRIAEAIAALNGTFLPG
jgi:LysR family transcriptional regulator, low CO2-responsive transcriptional regulator